MAIAQHTAMGLIWLMKSKPWSEYREINPFLGTDVYKPYYLSTLQMLMTSSAQQLSRRKHKNNLTEVSTVF